MTRDELIAKTQDRFQRQLQEANDTIDLLEKLPAFLDYEIVHMQQFKCKASVVLKSELETVYDTLRKLVDVFKPLTLNIYKDSCTSIFPDLCLTPKDVKALEEGWATIEPIFPIYFRIDYTEATFSWYTTLEDMTVIKVCVRVPRNKIHPIVRLSRKVVDRERFHPNDPERHRPPEWLMNHEFGGPSRYIRWSGGTADMPNEFTIYWATSTSLEEIFKNGKLTEKG